MIYNNDLPYVQLGAGVGNFQRVYIYRWSGDSTIRAVVYESDGTLTSMGGPSHSNGELVIGSATALRGDHRAVLSVAGGAPAEYTSTYDSGSDNYYSSANTGFLSNTYGGSLLAAAWDRVLTSEEHWSLQGDPWQLIAPLRRRLYFFSTAAGDQTITASSIATLEIFGSHRLDLEIAATGLASAEAFGTDRLDFEIAASGLASLEAFGTASLDHVIGATGIGTAEAFGTARLDLQIDLSGIASLEAFGSHSVNLDTEQSITGAGAIASLEIFGTARIDFTLLAAAIASGETFDTARLDLNITASGVASSEAFGAHLVELDTGQSITNAGGIAGAEAFGLTQLDLVLLMAALASGETFGSHTITGGASTFILTGRRFTDSGGRTFSAPPKGRTIH